MIHYTEGMVLSDGCRLRCCVLTEARIVMPHGMAQFRKACVSKSDPRCFVINGEFPCGL